MIFLAFAFRKSEELYKCLVYYYKTQQSVEHDTFILISHQLLIIIKGLPVMIWQLQN